MKVVTIIGARPQIIKASALSRAIRKFSGRIEEIIIHTGQHYDANMSEVFIREMDVPSQNYNLGVGSSTHAKQTALIMQGIEEILLKEKPDATIVFGDTNSTLAGSVASAKLHIPVVHIEAGLRSFNKSMPEEINRICCDHVSTLLFAPTATAIRNLEKESLVNHASGISIDHPGVYLSGDVMYDNSLHFSAVAEKSTDILERLKLTKNNFFLVTIHRESNTDNRDILESLLKAFVSAAIKYNMPVVLPLHPRTRKMVSDLSPDLKDKITRHITTIDPVSFLEMMRLESACRIIMTDSGGVQKEAYFMKKPCIILREETEWVELVESGHAKLAGTSEQKIFEGIAYFMDHQQTEFPEFYGNGKAAEFICEKMLQVFGG